MTTLDLIAELAPTHWMDDRGLVVTDEFLRWPRSSSDWRWAYYIPCVKKGRKIVRIDQAMHDSAREGGEARGRWVDRCIAEGKRRKVLLLIPAHTETRIFQRALHACTSVLLVQARLRFGVLRENGRQEAASHGSAMFGFGVDLTPLAAMGTVLQPNP